MLTQRTGTRTLLAFAVSCLSFAGCDRQTPTAVEAREPASGAAATRAAAGGSSLVSVDDPVFGPGAVTRDNATGLEWLDLTFSTNRSFEDITGVNGPNQLDAGGDFAGWRYATVPEIRSLFVDAGIPDVPGFSAANRDPVVALMTLVGITCVEECSGNPTSLGISATPDPANPPLLFIPNLQDWPPSFARVDFTLLIGPATRGRAWGSWLVRTSQDVTPPDTRILSVVADGAALENGGATLSRSISVTFTGSDEVGVVGFECRLDGASFSPCASPASYDELNAGVHLFEVRAADGAGNVDASPAGVAWKVITPSEAIQNLLTSIAGMRLDRGIANSLAAPLGEASRLLGDGNPNNDVAACNKVGAFAREVEAKARSGRLTTAQAAALLEAAMAIRRALACQPLALSPVRNVDVRERVDHQLER
jgi:hypothetical protein